MLQLERWEDPEEVHRQVQLRAQGKLWTALPVVVLDDSDGHVVSVQPTIMGKKLDKKTGVYTDVPMPSLGTKVPVQFASGGGFTLTHPIKKGDEGIVVFAARCIDGWWQQGGIQPQLDERYHNLSDGMFIPGIRSVPRKLSPPASPNSTQLRSDDGETYFEVAPNGALNLVAPDSGHCNVQGKVVMMPDLPMTDPHKAGQLWVDPTAQYVIKQSQG
jgi:hypothetical protein